MMMLDEDTSRIALTTEIYGQNGLDVIGNGIEKVIETVTYWSLSSKRLELLEDTVIRQLKMKSPKKLVLDCKTMWNSTYIMLDVALMYKDVFIRLQQHDSQCIVPEDEILRGEVMDENDDE
ncbi:hypothetical protein Dsin_009286 [Dipteronia sinensis]|uniref:Uncharacterized protein n=1 Tax=Dipteronia sinensis TaxID=43782 RepID=A0AAE0EBL4_9ROSI|nr:hypothetical protein Dsin_009286 [Dipteronia sinensis]